MSRKPFAKYLDRNFIVVAVGLLRQFIHTGNNSAAIDQIDLDIKNLYRNIDVLVALKEKIRGEEIEKRKQEKVIQSKC